MRAINKIIKLLVLLVLFSMSTMAKPVTVNSPNGKVLVEIKIEEKLTPYQPGKRLYYSVQYDGKTVLLESPFGLDFKNMSPLAENLKIVETKKTQVNEKNIEV